MKPVVHTGYPDQFLSIGRVTLGEKARNAMREKPKKEREKMAILRAACALLNTGGGVIRMEADNQDYSYSTDALGRDLEEALGELVKPAIMNDFFMFSQQRTALFVFVKSWCSSSNRARICSINTGLHRRSGASAVQVPPSAVSDLLRREREGSDKTDKIDQFYRRDTVNLNELLEFGEGMTVEFKDFRGGNLLDRLRECLPKYISAFANTEGGFLFVGVDDERRVTGCGRGENKEQLRRRVEEICGKAITLHQRNCQNRDRDRHRDRDRWSVEHRFIEVLDESMTENMRENTTENISESQAYVLAIKIPAFCCAVFEKDPDSWQMKDSELCHFTAEEWLKMMESTDPDIDPSTDSVKNLVSCFKKQLQLSDAPPQCRTVYALQEDHLKQLQATLFPVLKDDISRGPDQLMKDLTGEYENFQNLQSLERPEDAPGILIFSRSWAVDIGRLKDDRVICDALLICQNSRPCLYTVVEEGSPDLREYAASTAFHLKQKLVNVGGYSDRICVVPKLVNSQTGKLIPGEQDSPDGGVGMLYPGYYELGSEGEVESVLRSLVIVLLSFTSALSDELGCEFLNLLTEEQFQFLQRNEGKKRLFVHGVPGSGKTMLAAERVKRIKNAYHCSTENILYICENRPLRNFMSKKNICNCVTRKTFMKENEVFPEVKHIIVDEGQNFREEDGDWFEKVREIVQETGELWVFLDHFQQSHLSTTGLPPLSEQSWENLHTAVRYSTQVSVHLKEAIDNICKSFIRYPENLIQRHLKDMGDELSFAHSFPGAYEVKKMAENEVVPYLRRKLCKLLKDRISPKNIAVLFSTVQESSMYTQALDSKTAGDRICFTSAEEMDGDAVVVDSVRRFSGLERDVVILVNPRAHPRQIEIDPQFLVSAISRARIRLIVIYYISTGAGTWPYAHTYF